MATKREKMAASFKKAALDQEILQMAEEGLGDYVQQLDDRLFAWLVVKRDLRSYGKI